MDQDVLILHQPAGSRQPGISSARPAASVSHTAGSSRKHLHRQQATGSRQQARFWQRYEADAAAGGVRLPKGRVRTSQTCASITMSTTALHVDFSPAQ